MTTSAGRAVIEPAPFRIAFQDRSGRTLLREVPNREPAGRPLPLTRDPEPFALEREPDNASYSPLGFELGRERRAQWNAGFWSGDMLFSRRYGSAHFAHRVLERDPDPRAACRHGGVHEPAAPAASSAWSAGRAAARSACRARPRNGARRDLDGGLVRGRSAARATTASADATGP